jgi:hypothetical protein
MATIETPTDLRNAAGKQAAQLLLQNRFHIIPLKGKDPYEQGWQTKAYPLFDLEARVVNGDNLGMVFGQDMGDGTRLIGLDVDFERVELSQIAARILGRFMIRARGGPKFLALMRVRGTEAGSRDNHFYNGPDLGAERQSIQVLGRGQKAPAGPKQAACWGIHPSGQPYTWYADSLGRTPFNCDAHAVEYVDDLAGLLKQVADELEPLGWTLKAPRAPTQDGTPAFTGPFSAASIEDAVTLLNVELSTLERMVAGSGRGDRAHELGLQIGALVKAGHIDLGQTLGRLREAMPDNDNALREFERGVERSEGQRQRTIYQRENPGWADAAAAQGFDFNTLLTGTPEGSEGFNAEARADERNRQLVRFATDAAAKAIKKGDTAAFFEALKLMASVLAAGFATNLELLSWWGTAADAHKLADKPNTRAGEQEAHRALAGLQPSDPEWATWAAKFIDDGADPESAVKRGAAMRGQSGASTVDDEDDTPDAWDVDGDGVALPATYSNFAFFLGSQLGLRAELDTFTSRVSFRRLPGQNDAVSDVELARWNQSPDAAAQAIYAMATDTRLPWAPAAYSPKLTDVKQWLAFMAGRRAFNSLSDRMAAWPAWDGKERLRSWLGRYMGYAPWDPSYRYVCLAGQHFMCNWVARLIRPGHKFDEVLSIVGLEGGRKTTLFEALADAVVLGSYLGGQKFQFDDSTGINRVADITAGKTLVELAELKRLVRMDPENFKAQISKTHDSGRKSHGADSYDKPRQFSFVGTANVTPKGCEPEDITRELLALPPELRDARTKELMAHVDAGFLVDGTGSRRFLPALVMRYKMDLEGIKEEAEQLIAEAKHVAIAADFSLHMDDALEQERVGVTGRFRETDGLEDALAGALAAVDSMPSIKLFAEDARRLLGFRPGEKRTALKAAMAKVGLEAKHTKHGACYYRGDWDTAVRLVLQGGPGSASLVATVPFNPG